MDYLPLAFSKASRTSKVIGQISQSGMFLFEWNKQVKIGKKQSRRSRKLSCYALRRHHVFRLSVHLCVRRRRRQFSTGLPSTYSLIFISCFTSHILPISVNKDCGRCWLWIGAAGAASRRHRQTKRPSLSPSRPKVSSARSTTRCTCALATVVMETAPLATTTTARRPDTSPRTRRLGSPQVTKVTCIYHSVLLTRNWWQSRRKPTRRFVLSLRCTNSWNATAKTEDEVCQICHFAPKFGYHSNLPVAIAKNVRSIIHTHISTNPENLVWRSVLR